MKETQEKIEEKSKKHENPLDITEDFHQIYSKASSLLDADYQIPLNIDKVKVTTKNFIFTENAIKKLKEIKY